MSDPTDDLKTFFSTTKVLKAKGKVNDRFCSIFKLIRCRVGFFPIA
jgi:hypothetical protein